MRLTFLVKIATLNFFSFPFGFKLIFPKFDFPCFLCQLDFPKTNFLSLLWKICPLCAYIFYAQLSNETLRTITTSCIRCHFPRIISCRIYRSWEVLSFTLRVNQCQNIYFDSKAPTVGLEPTTTRLRALRSAD